VSCVADCDCVEAGGIGTPVPLFCMFIVCGEEAWDSERVGRLCCDNPSSEVYALPWIRTKESLLDNLSSNGGRPNRLWPCEHNTEPMDGPSQEFDEKLGNDGLGKMANLVATGREVLNQVMSCSFRCPFYGQVVCHVPRRNSTFMLSLSGFEHMFSSAPLSARLYAATTVPVRFETTHMFSEESGVGAKEVDIIIANDYLPGSVVFMRFYKVMTGKDYVVLRDFDERMDSKIPVFRYNKGYGVGKDA